MIQTVGESTIHKSVKSGSDGAEMQRSIEVQKMIQIRHRRPVEKSEYGRQAESENNSRPQDGYSRHHFEDGQIVLEKYDRSGRLVKKIPPGYVPFGEIA